VPGRSFLGFVGVFCAAMTGCSLTGSPPAATPTSPSEPTTATEPGPPVLGHVEKQDFEISGSPSAVAAGFGSVWVSSTEGVIRLNPSSGQVVGRLRIPSAGEWSAVSVGAGAVFYLDSPGTIAEVSPTTMKTSNVLRFGTMNGREAFFNIAATRAGVCTASTGTGYGLLCFAAGSNHAAVRVPLPEGNKPVTAAADGSIWVGGNSLTSVNIAAHTTKTIRLPDHSAAGALATEGDTLWAAINSNGPARLFRITDSRIASTLTLPPVYVEAIAASNGRVWVLTTPMHNPSNSKISYVRKDGSLLRIATLPPNCTGLSATRTALWTVRYHQHAAIQITNFG
jgi:hypothetical protein